MCIKTKLAIPFLCLHTQQLCTCSCMCEQAQEVQISVWLLPPLLPAPPPLIPPPPPISACAPPPNPPFLFLKYILSPLTPPHFFTLPLPQPLFLILSYSPPPPPPMQSSWSCHGHLCPSTAKSLHLRLPWYPIPSLTLNDLPFHALQFSAHLWENFLFQAVKVASTVHRPHSFLPRQWRISSAEIQATLLSCWCKFSDWVMQRWLADFPKRMRPNMMQKVTPQGRMQKYWTNPCSEKEEKKRKQVSKLVFNAQSTGTVISGQKRKQTTTTTQNSSISKPPDLKTDRTKTSNMLFTFTFWTPMWL